MSNAFMGSVIGIAAALLYFAAPFFSDEKRALQSRILGEILMALMFFYLSCFPGTVYFGFLALSAAFEKKIEENKWFSLIYGIIGAVITILFNNNGVPGIVLGLSLVLVFLHSDEQKQLTFTSYLEALTSFILLYYCLSQKAWVGLVFSIILFIAAIAGMVSSIRLLRAGGYEAAAREERQYQAEQAKKREERKNKKAAKKRRN